MNDWLQHVPLINVTPTTKSNLVVSSASSQQEFAYLEEFTMFTARYEENVSLDNTDLIFAGCVDANIVKIATDIDDSRSYRYGIVAPEWGWNDYEGLDVKGKTVVVIVNDPGLADESK